MRTHFETKKLVPCYLMDGRCKKCKLAENTWPSEMVFAMPRMYALREKLLEPLRLRYGKPIRVLRGFMCWKELQKLKKRMRRYEDEYDVDYFQYYSGECVDITATHGARKIADGADEYMLAENLKLARMIEEMEFDQLIVFEDYVHVSYSRKMNRHEVIYKVKGYEED